MADIIITKVYDKDCDICLHMSKHDRATFESFSDVGFREVRLDDIISQSNAYRHLYQCLDSYCLNSDYSIDLPVYIAQNKQGQFLGHVKGANTVVELREWVKSISDTTGTSSE